MISPFVNDDLNDDHEFIMRMTEWQETDNEMQEVGQNFDSKPFRKSIQNLKKRHLFKFTKCVKGKTKSNIVGYLKTMNSNRHAKANTLHQK